MGGLTDERPMIKKDAKALPAEALSRRRFIGLGTASLAVSFLSRLDLFASPDALPPDRSLSFYNTHTCESVSAQYCCSGCYEPSSLAKINHILRDHRTGETKEIDVVLLDLLFALAQKVGAEEGVFHVISGYRSPRTNDFLRERGRGVAAKSLHLTGKAIDIRLPGVRLRDLYRAALSLRGGGVGIYTKSDFIHVDVGRVRSW
jgi:uncharacterized protein YcbK (DUF882 family)